MAKSTKNVTVQQDDPTQPAISEEVSETKTKIVQGKAPVPEALQGTEFKPYKSGSKEAWILSRLFTDGVTIPELVEWYSSQGWEVGNNTNNLGQFFSNIKKRLEKGKTGYTVISREGRRFAEKIAN